MIKSNQISQKYWQKILPQQYIQKGCLLTLSSIQVSAFIQGEISLKASQFLTPEQIQTIQQALKKSETKALSVKVNNRTPKDLPLIHRKITKIQDFIQILHQSEYLLESLEMDKDADIVFRQFNKQIAQNNNIYQVFVRSGYIIAIGQKISDHIEALLTQDQLSKIINSIQQILPAITLISPKGSELNSFACSVYCVQNQLKITSISQYPPLSEQHHSFTNEQLEKYNKEINENLHKSEQQKYEQNEGVIPLIRIVTKQSEIKHYDMGGYQSGHQLDTNEKLAEWKQFMQEANIYLAKQEQ